MKVLALTLHRLGRSPGQRYRIEQYLNFLASNDVHVRLSPLLKTAKEDKNFYSSGKIFLKSLIGFKGLIRRFRDIILAPSFDVVFIFRDAFYFGTFVERLLKMLKCKVVYDFDDAIWLMDQNPNQGVFNKLKDQSKISKIISISDTVIAGNSYLKQYAVKYNPNTVIIPSTIDFNLYSIQNKSNSKTVCIGWTGSFSTIKHFETVIPALQVLKQNYLDNIAFKLIGDPNYENKELNISGIPWKAETEAQDLAELDIGIMPLPDNEWTRGKCGMKGLQYMALGIPTIMSPVGVNSDIIQDGVNGYLAGTHEEWVDKLILLIENEDLRKRLGKAGQKTVEENYSVEANKDKWLEVFQG